MRRRPLLLAAAVLLGTGRGLAQERPPLDANGASRADLESLPGIGPALAERLLNARAEAPFSDWSDLRRRVRGIGPRLAARLSAEGLRVQGRPWDGAATAEPAASVSAPIQSD